MVRSEAMSGQEVTFKNGATFLLGVDRRTVYRWEKGLANDPDYSIKIEKAEELCDRVGLHPREVWGDDYDRAVWGPLAWETVQQQVDDELREEAVVEQDDAYYKRHLLAMLSGGD